MLTREDTRRLAHLLRRAGFGARPDEWAAWANLGVAGATDALLHPEATPDHLAEVAKDIGGDYIDVTSLDSLKDWWLYRMAHTQRPLEEKMTLFWHNHFATANFKVDHPQWMWRQNQLFRTHALGNFRTLLQAVSRDPAMLIWLDGVSNKKEHANENYGRELLELFTMGFGSGYTEKDVKEAARAFTGWRFNRDTGDFEFHASDHDEGEKTFLGETGNFSGDDIIEIVVRQPATARFLCTKLFRFFIHDDPAPADTRPFEAVYFQSGYDLRAVVGAMLQSPAFYAPNAVYAKIKSPVEYCVTAIRTLDAPLSVASKDDSLHGRLQGMGQELFNPPNVKGWPEGRSWMNTMTLIARVGFANHLVRGLDARGLLTDRLRASLAAQGFGAAGMLGTPDGIVTALWETFLPGHTPSAATQSALTAYVRDGHNPSVAHFDSKAAGLTTLILSAPEYHLA